MPQINIPGLGPVNFPETMSDDDIQEASARLFRENQERTAPENLDLGMKTPEEAAAIAQSRPPGPIDVGMRALPQSMAKVMEGMDYNERVDATIGKPVVDMGQAIMQAVQGGELSPEQQADVQAWRALSQGASSGEGEGILNAGTVGELVGGIGGGAAMAPLAGPAIGMTGGKVLPMALTRSPTAAGVAGGAAGGAAQPVLDGESATRNAALGALTGGALPATMARVARPIPVRPDAATLIDKGVVPTIGTGMSLGGVGRFLESIENMASSIMPGARESARAQATQVMGNRATPPGGTTPDFTDSQKAFQELRGQYDDAYQAVHSQMQPVDSRWLQQAVAGVTDSLEGRVPRSYRNSIKREIEDVLAEADGPVTGERLAKLMTLTKDKVRAAGKSQSPGADSALTAWNSVKDTLEQVQKELLPEEAFSQLQQVNKAYSQMRTMQDATKTIDGLSPETVAAATRKDMSSPAYSRGQGNFRDITDLNYILQKPRPRTVMNVGGGLLTSPLGLPLAAANLARTPLLGATRPQKSLRAALLSEELRRAFGAFGVGTGTAQEE